MKKKITAILCMLTCTAALIPGLCVNAENTEKDLKDAVGDAVTWKDKNDNPLYSIGTYGSDFYIIALRRMGKSYDYSAYLRGLDGIAAGYGAEHNASDMQRTAMAAIASGGDARNVGGRDLIADGVHYRNATSPIDKEGVGGYAWGLIALDSGSFETPDWAILDRNSIIAGILSHQNTDGSFDGSVYSTAACMTALAPYYETSGAYTITQNQTGYVFDISPKDAVNNAIEYLEEQQTRDGDFGDLKSTAMTVIALDTLGIDADNDRRFVARSGSAVDGLLMYQNKDGGFSADLNKSDGDATSFALCALASQLRARQNKTPLFALDTGDNNVFVTPAPTQKPSSGTTAKATTKPSTSRATAKPSSSGKTKATTKPKTSSSPDATARPTTKPTPRPTKRPALVGPVEVPGPMPTRTPYPTENSMGEDEHTTGVPVAAIVIAVAALAALLAAAVIFVKKGNAKKISPILNVFRSKKNKKKDIKTNKNRRKTAERRKFEQREKFKQRNKFRK